MQMQEPARGSTAARYASLQDCIGMVLFTVMHTPQAFTITREDMITVTNRVFLKTSYVRNCMKK